MADSISDWTKEEELERNLSPAPEGTVACQLTFPMVRKILESVWV